MLTFDQGLALLHTYKLDEKRIAHSIGVAAIAFALAERIRERHPHLKIDPPRVRLAGLLHDIGRTRPGDHETNAVAILLAEGQPDLADRVMHGTLYEARTLSGKADMSLLPQTIEGKIVAYADTRFRLEPVPLVERIADIQKRRSHEKKKLAAVELAIPRIEALEREILTLAGIDDRSDRII
jgi:putative nucleotidyltransferase with HDIG domain